MSIMKHVKYSTNIYGYHLLESTILLALKKPPFDKQATAGNNTTGQPWAINVKARAKWDSWKSYEGTDKSLVQSEYVALVEKLKVRLGVTH